MVKDTFFGEGKVNITVIILSIQTVPMEMIIFI